MKKKIVSRLLPTLLATLTALTLMGCTVTKTETVTDENGNTTATTTTTDESGTTSVVESMKAEQTESAPDDDELLDEADIVEEEEIVENLTIIESDYGYKVTFNPEYFVYEEGGEYEGEDYTYIRCIVDEENQYDNFISVSHIDDYTAKDLIEGIAYQNDVEVDKGNLLLANGEYEAYSCTYYVMDNFIVTTYTIPASEGSYKIEIGSHVYGDDDPYVYQVSGIMEETFLDLEFAK